MYGGNKYHNSIDMLKGKSNYVHRVPILLHHSSCSCRQRSINSTIDLLEPVIDDGGGEKNRIRFNAAAKKIIIDFLVAILSLLPILNQFLSWTGEIRSFEENEWLGEEEVNFQFDQMGNAIQSGHNII